MTTILPPLDDEQLAALTQLRGDDTAEDWGRDVLLGLIDEQVGKNIDARGAALLQAAKALPKEKRLQFTAETTAVYQSIAGSLLEDANALTPETRLHLTELLQTIAAS